MTLNMRQCLSPNELVTGSNVYTLYLLSNDMTLHSATGDIVDNIAVCVLYLISRGHLRLKSPHKSIKINNIAINLIITLVLLYTVLGSLLGIGHV